MKKNDELLVKIRSIYYWSKQRYGSPKIMKELKTLGYQVSRPRVARLMKANNLRSIVNKKFKVQTTDSAHNHPIKCNLLNRDFKVSKPSQTWVSDITYIPTNEGWLYLTMIMDLFDRKVIGWSLSNNMTARDTVLRAFQMALKNRCITTSMIFHLDRGVQYACQAFTEYLEAGKVRQSMSRKGDCCDNAVAENFFKILNSELGKIKYFSLLKKLKIRYLNSLKYGITGKGVIQNLAT